MVTIADLAQHFKLEAGYLEDIGLSSSLDYSGKFTVAISYGDKARTQERLALEGSEKHRWKSGEQNPIRLYGARFKAYPPAHQGSVILTEGASDCWVLWNSQIEAMGVPGASMFKTIEAEDLEGYDQIFVSHEPGDAGNKFLAGVMERLAELFPAEPRPQCFDLPWGDYGDPADLWKANPDSESFTLAVKGFMEEADELTYPVGRSGHVMTARTVASVYQNPPPEIEPIVEGLIFPGDRIVIGGARGAAKSWLGMGLATQLAKGTGNFMGKREFPVKRVQKVLFVHGELEDDSSTYNRWKTLSPEMPVTLLETFDPFRVRTRTYRQSDKGFSMQWEQATVDEGFEELIDEVKPDFVFLDPYKMFIQGNENDNDVTDNALTALQAIFQPRGITSGYFQHFSQARSGSDVEDWWRGATRLADWASVRITLEPAYKDSDIKRHKMDRMVARRYARVHTLLRKQKTPPAFYAQWNPETRWWESWEGPDEGGRPAEEYDIREAFNEAEGGMVKSIRHLASLTDWPKSTAERRLDKALADGVVQKLTDGGYVLVLQKYP